MKLFFYGNFFRRSIQNSVSCIYHRKMTTTEVSTALRPFYFSVHPDLFGQHPQQRVYLQIPKSHVLLKNHISDNQ